MTSMTYAQKIFSSKNFEKTCLFFVYLYSLTVVPFEHIGEVSRNILIILSLPIIFIHHKRLLKDPMVILLGLAIAAQTLSWVNSIIYLPDFANQAPKIDRLAKLFTFIFIAYWLKGKEKRTYILWSLFTVGFIIGCIVHSDFTNEITKALSGRRVDFSIKNAQFTSMFASTCLLILVFLLSRTKKLKTNITRVLSISTILLAIAFSIFVIIASQSRQAWLTLMICMLTLPLLHIIVYKSTNKKAVISIYLVLVMGIIALSQIDFIKKRALKEQNTWYSIFSGNVDHIPMSSIGIRMNSWLEASQWIKERPILGNGPEAIGLVIQQSEKFQGRLKGFGHLHNYHIEVLVSYGLLGLLIIYAMYYWLAKSLLIRQQFDSNIRSFSLFSLVFITFWGCINFFETFNGRTYGVFTHNIIFAGLYTFHLTASITKPKNRDL
ncbi:O-antigen ligase family protein [Vibrio coralliirubri]|uniref:O-antigen ligase family protein n=1 Tax=Vibrio coralliirubri TaxID=1516159 RepID=UPI000A36E964|nr:O-antigen ligase family protein [Vibrio coralliirubri]